jgi:hypothetical protein
MQHGDRVREDVEAEDERAEGPTEPSNATLQESAPFLGAPRYVGEGDRGHAAPASLHEHTDRDRAEVDRDRVARTIDQQC